MLQELSSKDCTTIRISIVDYAGVSKDILVCSAYFPHDEPSPTEIVRKIVEYSRQKDMNLIIGCDSNSHHEEWGSIDTNDRGKQLLKYLTSTGFDIVNRGDDPTFIAKARSEVLDLTLRDLRMKKHIYGWKFNDEPSVSDHMTILLKMLIKKEEVVWSRNPRLTKWEDFKVELGKRVRLLKGEYGPV